MKKVLPKPTILQLNEYDVNQRIIEALTNVCSHAVLFSIVNKAKDAEKISDELSIPIRMFSYPEGQLDDYDQPSIDYLKSIGVDMCPTAIEGVNNYKKTDPFHISRCMIGFEGRSFVLD